MMLHASAENLSDFKFLVSLSKTTVTMKMICEFLRYLEFISEMKLRGHLQQSTALSRKVRRRWVEMYIMSHFSI